LYPLHPVRPQRGKTANKSHDGLFNIGASFSAGYGSLYGRGWVFDVHISTLSSVPAQTRAMIYSDAVFFLQKLLQRHYPERKIKVKKDGLVFKIFGDLQISFKNLG